MLGERKWCSWDREIEGDRNRESEGEWSHREWEKTELKEWGRCRDNEGERSRCCVVFVALWFLLLWKKADASDKRCCQLLRACVLFGARTKRLLKLAQNAPFCANLCAQICDNIVTVPRLSTMSPSLSRARGKTAYSFI